MHVQIGMPADSVCGAHAPSDRAMHKTSAGAHTHEDGAMHTGSLGESDGIADRPSSMHRQISMPADSACGAHAMRDSTMHKTTADATLMTTSGAMHTGSIGKSDGIADRHSGMHAQNKC